MKTTTGGRECLAQAVLEERARRADRAAFGAVMLRAGGTSPRKGDEIDAVRSNLSSNVNIIEYHRRCREVMAYIDATRMYARA